MSGAVINLIIQLIAGALGGNVVGAELKNVDLGAIGNSIVGALGGVAGGTFLTGLVPLLHGTADTVDISSIIIGQAAGGAVCGVILTTIIGRINNAVAGLTTRRNISRKRGNLPHVPRMAHDGDSRLYSPRGQG